MIIPPGFAEDAPNMSLQKLADKYGMGKDRVRRLRENGLGIFRHRKIVDKAIADSLIPANADEFDVSEIAKTLGCSESVIYRRRRELYGRITENHHGTEVLGPMIPPQDRLEMFISKRMEQFQITREAVIEWLKTAGRDIMREYPLCKI